MHRYLHHSQPDHKNILKYTLKSAAKNHRKLKVAGSESLRGHPGFCRAVNILTRWLGGGMIPLLLKLMGSLPLSLRQMGRGAPASVSARISVTRVPPVSLRGGCLIPCHVGPCLAALAVLSPLQTLSPMNPARTVTPRARGQGFWVGRPPFPASGGSWNSGLAAYAVKSARISVKAPKDAENACFVPHVAFSGSPLRRWNQCPFFQRLLRCSGDSAGPCRGLLEARRS